MSAEQGEKYANLGIRQENPNLGYNRVRLFVWASDRYAAKTGLVVNGSVPEFGEGIFFANHIDDLDVLRMLHASIRHTQTEDGEPALGRLPHGLGKSNLFGIPEPSAIKRRTGKKDVWNSDSRLVRALIGHTVGSLLLGIGTHPVRRGMTDRVALSMVDEDLANHELVATSVIESRDKTGGLKGLKTGPAALIMTHPDTPFYLVSISKQPHVLSISKPYTVRQVTAERGEMGLRSWTMFFADGIMDMQPGDIRGSWVSGGREEARQELYGPDGKKVFSRTS